MKSFWLEAILFMAWLYIAFHITPLIAFLDRLIAS